MRSKAFNAISHAYLSLILFSSLLLPLHAAEAKPAADTTPENPVFARINDTVIHFDEFTLIFRNAVRNKFSGLRYSCANCKKDSSSVGMVNRTVACAFAST